jgi:LysM repeat protein
VSAGTPSEGDTQSACVVIVRFDTFVNFCGEEVLMRLTRYRGRHLRPKPKRHGPVVAIAAASVSIASPAYAGVHTVRAGETVSGVAARYGVSVDAIVRANGLADADLIVTGERLRIPARVTTRTHEVKAGETLSAIADRYGTTVERVARNNHIADPNLIIEGQILRIRGGSGAVTGAASGGGIEGSLERHAAAQGVEADLVKAVAWQESGWRQKARSSAGAIGVMQVMPDTADYVNQVLGGGNLDVREADDNVQLGVRYLRHVRDLMGGSTRKGLAAYYSGPGNVKRRLAGYQKTYVNSVQALRQRFK